MECTRFIDGFPYISVKQKLIKKTLPITDEDRSDCLNFREVLFTAALCSTKLIELQGGAVYCRAMLHPDMSEWVEILWIQLQENIFSFFCEFTKQNDSHGESCPSTLTKGRDRGFYTSVLTYRACV